MLPTNTSKTFLAVSLGPGPIHERPITNEQFLSSFLDYGCWFRSVAAYSHLKTLERTDTHEIERLAALTTFYQLAGQAVEDVLTNLIAWSIWTDDKSQNMADIIERLSLRLSIPNSPTDQKYISEIKQKFRDKKKRVDLYPREYLRELINAPDSELPARIGIEWKRNPSVKLVPSELRPMWDELPKLIRGVIQPLTTGRGDLLAACYNKAKHGPQLVVSRPIEGALSRGSTLEKLASEQANTMSVRLLMDGARTQETDEEASNNIRIAPFIINDISNIKRWYYQQLVHYSQSLFGLGTWLFNTTYKNQKREFGSPNEFVQEILMKQIKHTDDITARELLAKIIIGKNRV